jgi:hypothetical protein
MHSSQLSKKSQYHTQDNAFPSQPEFSNNSMKVLYKLGTSPQNEIETRTNHIKESEHWFNKISPSNRYTPLLEVESED